MSAAVNSGTTEGPVARVVLITVALVFLALFLALPLLAVFVEALKAGIGPFHDAISTPDAISAIKLTLLVAGISVPLNMVFGVTASWAITKFSFPGKSLLTTLIDLPFSVSPVVSGLIFVLLFGAQGMFGQWLADHLLPEVVQVGRLQMAGRSLATPTTPAVGTPAPTVSASGTLTP